MFNIILTQNHLKGFATMLKEKALVGKIGSLLGQIRKAACSGIDGLVGFDSSKLLRDNARNVSLFASF